MNVLCSFAVDPTIAAIIGPARWLLDLLSELLMTGERQLKKWTIYVVENKEQGKHCDT
jgi:hypothetical protein